MAVLRGSCTQVAKCELQSFYTDERVMFTQHECGPGIADGETVRLREALARDLGWKECTMNGQDEPGDDFGYY